MKLAVFDLDGTLVNSLADLADAVNYSMRTLGFPEHELEKYKYFVGNGAKKLIERALPEDKQEHLEEALTLFSEYYGKNYTVNTCVYEGIHDLLGVLSENGVTLAAASNKPHNFTENVISHYFGNKLFSAVYGKMDGMPPKPDPALLNMIIEKTNADKKDCFMIGDSKMDIQTGKNAGITTIGCLWGFRMRDELVNAGADHIAERPYEIARIILTK